MSLSLDFASMLQTVGDLVTGFWPIFVVPIGFALAFAIIGFLYSKITDALKGI